MNDLSNLKDRNSISNELLPRHVFQWLLLPFIVGLLTLSHFEGLSRIMVAYGFGLSFLYLMYIFYHKKRMLFQPEILFYFLLILWSLIGGVKALDFGLFKQGFMTMCQIGIMMTVVAGITAWYRNFSIVMVAVLVGGIIVLLPALITGEFQMASEIETRTRAEGLTKNANGLAYCSLYVIFSIFYLYKKNKHLLWRSVLIVLFVVSIIAIVYSGSRKGFLGFLSFVALWFLYCKSKYFFKKPIYSFLLLFFLSATIYMGTEFVMTKTYLGKRLNYAKREGNPARAQMYKEGFELIAKNPITGVGLSNYRVYSSTGQYSHSDYIEVAANTGIVGFAIYFSIYLILWRRLKKVDRMARIYELSDFVGIAKASIITILIMAAGRPNIISKLTWIYMAGVIGYSWAIIKLSQSAPKLK